MTLQELGNQYLEEEKKLREKIRQLRAMMTEKGYDRDLEMRLQDLYTTAINLRSTGEYLINYYAEGDNDAA